MAGEAVDFEAAVEEREREQAAAAADSTARQQSTILFPYLDLAAAIEVAEAMHETRGHGSMEAHELAAQMNQTVSGAFRLKTGTARIFGLTERDGRDATRLSELGRLIIEPETQKAAKAEAFMRVPLYAAIYEKYKGQRLPPLKALEREMQALGVSSKQADKARQAFDRSAKQAGYKDKGDDRLVRPVDTLDKGAGTPADDTDKDREKNRSGGNGGGGGGFKPPEGVDHPLIQGLLVTLPPTGSEWATNDRGAWLRMAESIFGMIYKEPTPSKGVHNDVEGL